MNPGVGGIDASWTYRKTLPEMFKHPDPHDVQDMLLP